MRQNNHPGDCSETSSRYRDPRGTGSGRYQAPALVSARYSAVIAQRAPQRAEGESGQHDTSRRSRCCSHAM